MVVSSQYRVIGTRPIRPDGADKVTGRAEYSSDIRLAGLLHGRVKRSPHAHALIKSIDASKALALPGVRAVVTAADFPEVPDMSLVGGEGEATSLRHRAQNVMARSKALCRQVPAFQRYAGSKLV